MTAMLARSARVLRAAAIVTWKPLLTFALIFALFPAAVLGQEASPGVMPANGGLTAAIYWLLAQQAKDGGFPGFNGTSDPGTTCDAVYALAAAQAAGIDVAEPLADARAFLEANAGEFARLGAGQSAKLALAAVAAGGDPGHVGGVHPLEQIRSSADPTTGLFGSGLFDHALGILAFAAVGETLPPAALDALTTSQLADGSWAFDGSTVEGAGDVNTTALALQALVAAGQGESSLIAPAIAYLATAQVDSGAFGYQPGEPSTADANSTALVVQALIAVGMDPSAPDLLDPVTALMAFQNPSGAFRYTDDLPEDNLFATVQAIPALAGLPLPIVPGDADATPTA